MFGLFENKNKTEGQVDLQGTLEKQKKQISALSEVSNAVVGVVDLESIFDLIASKLIKVVDLKVPGIYTINKEKTALETRKVNVPSVFITIAERALDKKITDLVFPLTVKENLLVKAFDSKKIETSHSLGDFALPYLQSNVTSVLQTLVNVNTVLAIPLIAKDEVIGVLSVGTTKKEITPNDEEIINTFANQIAIAIYNSELFTQVQQQVSQLEFKNQDLSSLYNLTSKISQSLDPGTVAQTAVNSLPQNNFLIGATLNEYFPKEDAIVNIAFTETALSYNVIKAIGDPSKLKTPLSMEGADLSIVVKTFKQGVPNYSNDISELLLPIIPKPIATVVKGLLPVKSIATFPLKIREQIIGTITYLIKDKTVEQLSENEKQLLETYTLHITIALENAELYKQQKIIEFNLQKALNEVQALRQHEQDMIDIMGHELRTPISIVRNSLAMLEMELKNTGEIKQENLGKFLDISLESARREVKLVETLLSSAKADSRGFQLLFEKIDFLDVINDSLEFFTREADKKGLQVKYTKPNEEFFVYGDRTRVQEIMDNLLSNSVKYTDKGFVKISVRKDNDFAWIDISDTGIGMSEKDLKSIGQKFYRVDQYMDSEATGAERPNIIRPGGTGLGLYVTFSLIKVMDGKVEVKSQQGVGTTFSFSMPLFKGQESKQEQRKP